MLGLLRIIAVAALTLLPAPNHRAIKGPGLHVGWRIGWLNGLRYRVVFLLVSLFGGPKVVVGPRFCVKGKLRVRGTGKVVFGHDVIVESHTDIYTHSSQAIISIGAETFLNGTRFGCVDSITVGPLSILADARISDTDFHSISKNRHSRRSKITTQPVLIGSNVWIGSNVMIRRGVTIGDNSVIAMGSVVTRPVPNDEIFGGNPAKKIGEVVDDTNEGLGAEDAKAA